MTPSVSSVARAGSSFGILIGIALPHATRPPVPQALAKQKPRRADVPAPGFEHPGLLASCLTWLASRPAQIDHDDGRKIRAPGTPRQVRPGAGFHPLGQIEPLNHG